VERLHGIYRGVPRPAFASYTPSLPTLTSPTLPTNHSTMPLDSYSDNVFDDPNEDPLDRLQRYYPAKCEETYQQYLNAIHELQNAKKAHTAAEEQYTRYSKDIQDYLSRIPPETSLSINPVVDAAIQSIFLKQKVEQTCLKYNQSLADYVAFRTLLKSGDPAVDESCASTRTANTAVNPTNDNFTQQPSTADTVVPHTTDNSTPHPSTSSTMAQPISWP